MVIHSYGWKVNHGVWEVVVNIMDTNTNAASTRCFKISEPVHTPEYT